VRAYLFIRFSGRSAPGSRAFPREEGKRAKLASREADLGDRPKEERHLDWIVMKSERSKPARSRNDELRERSIFDRARCNARRFGMTFPGNSLSSMGISGQRVKQI